MNLNMVLATSEAGSFIGRKLSFYIPRGNSFIGAKMQYLVHPIYIVKVREDGWADKQMENKLDVVAGPIWSKREADVALIKQQSLNPGVKLDMKTLQMSCEEQ
jgi:hypothetical protein